MLADDCQRLLRLSAVFLILLAGSLPGSCQEPFKLEAEQRDFFGQPDQSYQSYPAPRMIGPQTRQPLTGGARKQFSAPKAPIPSGVQQKAKLPPQFLGVWQVQGRRTAVQAAPQYQAGAESAFAPQTTNVWQIAGSSASGYTMSSDSGIQTPFHVLAVQGNAATIKYQHPVGNTMAQEIVVMELKPGGASFSGLERISIVKQGEAQPRAQVTYELSGQRQR